ncbi:hypothetical protein ACKI1O_46060, partial [Streptomyces scabiei]
NSRGAVAQSGQGIGRSIFGGIVGGFAAIGGAKIVGDFLGGAISGASDLNETLSKSQTIFGANADAVESWASGAAQAMGLSKAAALEAAAGFGNMFTQIGFGAEEAARLSQSTVQMAADLGSFNNVPTADVADRISAAFRGEYDSLQSLIPNINAARVEQEAMAATGKTNARELTAQEKAAAVLAIVNKDGAAAMGDYAKTADGAANTQKTLTASLEDQQSKLGQTLMPLWQDFLGFLTDTAVPALSAIVDWISQNASWLGPLSAALGLATTAVWLFNIALNANPIMLIITAIGALVGGILWVATQTTFFQDVWTNVTNAIGTAWNWLWTTVLQPVFTAIGEVFNWIYNNIIMPIVTGIMIYVGLWAAVITWLWETVISPVFAAIGQAFNWIWNSVISPVIGFISGAINNVGIIFDWLYANAVKPAFDGVAGAFNCVWNSVISPVIGFISDAINNVGNTIRSVFGGIGSFIGSAFQAALNVVRGPINGIISLVNSAIRGLNSLSVTIPSWVPIVGGQTWGLNIPTIPMLAKGGTITGAGSVLVGENGPEILNVGRGASVVPLTGSQRTPVDGGEKHFHLEQKIYATDPILGARQAAREAARYLGV